MFYKIRHLQIGIHTNWMFKNSEDNPLEAVRKWHEGGNLKTITMYEMDATDRLPCYEDRKRYLEYRTYVDYRTGRRSFMNNFIEFLQSLAGSNGCLANIPRRLLFDWDMDEPEGKPHSLSEDDRNKRLFLLIMRDRVAEDYHKAFGGELWGSGKLLWKDNVWVGQTPRFIPSDGELQR